MYGGAFGAFARLAGIYPTSPEPPTVVLHWAYTAGQCAAAALIFAVIFSIGAIVHNLIIRRPRL
jgi:hypothetical protein